MALLLVLLLTSYETEHVNQRTGSLNRKSKARLSLSLFLPCFPLSGLTCHVQCPHSPLLLEGPLRHLLPSAWLLHLKLGSSICSASQSSFLSSILPDRGGPYLVLWLCLCQRASEDRHSEHCVLPLCLLGSRGEKSIVAAPGLQHGPLLVTEETAGVAQWEMHSGVR